jgi:serine/threonine-protein kinase
VAESIEPSAQLLNDATDDPMVGRMLGPNTVLAKVATGGMAEIYLAAQQGPLGLNRLVVVKRILTNLADSDQFRTMFYDEARIAAQLEHPNIIRVEDFGEDPTDQSLYMVMEYVEGVPLLDVLRRTAKLKIGTDQRWAATVVAQAAEGLHHAHELARNDGSGSLGLVHRDVSPHNLLITPNGIVKVFDFGIAKALDRQTQTAAGVIKGKFAYMSPEQARAQPVDRRSDVFSLAIVLWETLTLKRLFSRGNDLDTYRALLESPIPRVSEIRPDVYPELDEVVAYALARPPSDRFSTSRAFGQAITHAISRHGGLISNSQVGEVVQTHFGEALAARKRLAAQRRSIPPGAGMRASGLRRVDEIRIPGSGQRAAVAGPSTPEDVAVHQGRMPPVASADSGAMISAEFAEGSKEAEISAALTRVAARSQGRARPDEKTAPQVLPDTRKLAEPGFTRTHLNILIVVGVLIVGGIIAALTAS